MGEIRFVPAGDNGIIIEIGKEIAEEINRTIRGLIYCINRSKENFCEIVELIPAYTTILVIYNPLKTSYDQLVEKLRIIGRELDENQLPPANVIHVPVVYGGMYGPDLINVAQHNQLTEEEVITLHTSNKYLIYMIGFTPGFPYLGGMDEKIATPRLQAPRQKIPAGAVGIAGSQTGIYPIESPGGWQLIGRTPLKLFDPQREPAVMLEAGNYIQFEAVSVEEYQEIEAVIREGDYQVKLSQLKGCVHNG